jgi:hypothetical protein
MVRILEVLQGPRPPKDVTAKRCWTSPDMPALGLSLDAEAEFGIYVLRCKPHDTRTAGPFYYVGFHAFASLASRIEVQFSGVRGQSHYCSKNKPICVELVWPVCSRAAEAYIFYALLAKQPAGWERRGAEQLCPVGGFTQNDSVLSPLASLVYEQARRQLKSFCCYNCGGSHFASACKQPKRGLSLTCPDCKANIEMTSKGQTVTATKQSSTATAASSSRAQSPAPASSRGVKRSLTAATFSAGTSCARPSSPLVAAPSTQAAGTNTTSGKVISICGQHYTSLAWYLCKDNPSPTLCKRARRNCASNALVLEGGHTRSVKDFAKVPGAGRALKPLCVIDGQSRQRIGNAAVPTQVVGVKIRRAENPFTSRGSQVLWLLADLEAEFAK